MNRPFEALFLVIIIPLFFYYPSPFEKIGSQLRNNIDVLKFLPTIPLLIFGFTIKYAWKILFPMQNDSNKIYHEWPNYWKVKSGVIVSILFCFACVAGTFFIWICSSILSAQLIGLTFLVTYIISLIVAFHLLLASFDVREYLEP